MKALTSFFVDITNGTNFQLVHSRRRLSRLAVFGHFIKQEFQCNKAMDPGINSLVDHTNVEAIQLFEGATLRYAVLEERLGLRHGLSS